MAQMTGTQIVATARVFAQDTSTAGPAVSDANALVLLNDVLVRFSGDVAAKHSLLAASASGLTFSAGTAVKETSAQDLFDHILAAYESDANAVGAVLPPQLAHITVEEMLNLHNNNFDGTISAGGSSGWQAYAWERASSDFATTGTTVIRVYVYPALNATRYMTVRVPKTILLAALAETPDLSRREGQIVSRLLAWEMARLHARDEAFLGQILAPVPQVVLDAYYESSKRAGNSQAAPRDTGWSNG